MKTMTGEVAEKRDLLKNVEMFSALDAGELEVIADYSEVVEVEPEQHLFEAGQRGNSLYVVKSGSILISQTQGEGRQVDIAEYIEGECFGEIDVLHAAPRTATARAEKHCELLRFPRTGVTLEEVLDREPNVSARLLQKLIIAIANRIRETNKLISENSPWVEQLRRQVFGDKLTGMFNRNYLDEHLPTLLNEENSPLAVLMIKPDNFKIINDTYGHDAGDATLRLLAATVRTWAGDNPSIRYRGNEMAVILPNTGHGLSFELAEELRRKLSNLDLEPIVGSKSVEFTFSVGIAIYPDHAASAGELVARSHETLFIARDRGANQALSADQVEL